MLKNRSFLRTFIIFLASACFIGKLQAQHKAGLPRTVIPFDKDWRFIRSDPAGAENPDFDDSKWRKLDVPHDWSIEGPYNENNPTGRGGGYLPAGIGWYRKTFTLPGSEKDKEVFIDFDGIYRDSKVWINGHFLGERPNGYISFRYELTPYLHVGKEKNVLAVRVNDSLQPASRYYTGAGIYRHVHLVAVNPVHIAHWGVYLTTPEVSRQEALVRDQTEIVNRSAATANIIVKTTIMDPSGKAVRSSSTKETIAPGGSKKVVQDIKLTDPMLWGLDHPYLYKASTKIFAGDKVTDDQINAFGIREAKFEAATGFWLNGKNIKIKGVCLHHDVGCLGAAVPLNAWKRRFKLLKQAGVNAIRTAHNPPAPEFLDLCDKMGFLVMDEAFDTWNAVKNPAKYGYNLYFNQWWRKDIRSMIMRDRDHPSIIIYSVGNEIHDNLNSPEGFKKYKDLQDLVHQMDPSRPVTMALLRPGSSHVYTNGFANMMDVVGQNYRENELVAAHEAHPNWKVIGTENGQSLSAWLALRDNPFMAGQFLWVGFDYLGEAVWPAISNSQGLFNRIGGWRPRAFQRQSWWSSKPDVHIVRKRKNEDAGQWVANWTPVDTDKDSVEEVQVFSNCEQVTLFLNGRSLGSEQKPADDSPRSWEVPFEEGTIKAVGRNNGKEVAADELKTAGAPAKIILSTDQDTISNHWDDVSYIDVKVVDKNKVLCPYADNLIRFSLSGPGTIIGVDNGDATSHEPYQGSERQAYQGRCIAVIRAKENRGKIRITATSPGLKEGVIDIVIR